MARVRAAELTARLDAATAGISPTDADPTMETRP
jgi:hypothetical protein